MVDDHSLPFRERAYKHYQEAEKNITDVLEQSKEKNLDEIEDYRDPLSIETRKEVTILLSWGGPSDGYKIYLDQEGNPIEGYYFFADWFEYEEFKLRNEELDRILTIYCVE